MTLTDRQAAYARVLACTHRTHELVKGVTHHARARRDSQVAVYLYALRYQAVWYGHWGSLIEAGMLASIERKASQNLKGAVEG